MKSSIALSLLASSLSLISADAAFPTQQVVSSADAQNMTFVRYASFPSGTNPDLKSLTWQDTPTADHVSAWIQEATCHGEDCLPHGSCQTTRVDKVVDASNGQWLTAWCNSELVYGPNSVAFITQGHETSITYSGEISLAGPLSKFFNAKIGMDITQTRSVGQGVGCEHADDGQQHSVWLQENMGWGDTRIQSTFTFQGPGCPRPTQEYYNVHADWPSPNNSGLREIRAGCGGPLEVGKPPNCDLGAPHL